MERSTAQLCYDKHIPHITTCFDVNLNEYEIPTDELSWRPAAYGMVIRDGKVLLSRQFGKYDLPGGGVDLGEELTAGVLREIQEETGIEATRPKVLGVENSFFHSAHGNKKSYHSVLIYYVCNYVGVSFRSKDLTNTRKNTRNWLSGYRSNKLIVLKLRVPLIFGRIFIWLCSITPRRLTVV